MSCYYTNLLSFDAPETVGIEDRTINLLEIPRGGVPISMTVESAPAKAQSLEESARSLLASRRVRVPGFALLAEDVGATDDVPFLDFRIRFRDALALGYERQAHLEIGSRHVIVTVSSAMDDRDYADQWFEHTLRTLRVRN